MSILRVSMREKNYKGAKVTTGRNANLFILQPRVAFDTQRVMKQEASNY